ncbi:MAG TPA: Crp/Fnr family transcriptional regulator [Chryseosolibacter sp.]
MRNFLRKKRKLFPSRILQQYHARLLTLRKDQVLFHEGDQAIDYYQVEEGSVKMYIVSPDGQEFIQGIFSSGESFGEPALIGRFPYPGSAKALEGGKVWKLAGDYFRQMLQEHFDLHLKMTEVLCQRLRYKSMVLSEISSYEPDHRILSILKYFKVKNIKPGEDCRIRIPYTRQQIADMSGLRVETVIRTVKKMEKEGKLLLEGHKILF